MISSLLVTVVLVWRKTGPMPGRSLRTGRPVVVVSVWAETRPPMTAVSPSLIRMVVVAWLVFLHEPRGGLERRLGAAEAVGLGLVGHRTGDG